MFFAGEGKAGENKNLSVLAYAEAFWWARVDCASRAEKEPGSRLPAAASCLGRHAHPAGRSPNSSSLFLPLAAVVAVAVRIYPCVPFIRQIKQKLQYPVRILEFLVGAGGFEPPKLKAADLQSVPIGHSGTRPYSFVAHPYAGRLVYFSMRREICQLSFLLFFSRFKQHPTKAGKDAMTGAFYGNRALLWCNCRKEKAKII